VHPAILRQLAAARIGDLITEAGHARRADEARRAGQHRTPGRPGRGRYERESRPGRRIAAGRAGTAQG